jgi:deoxyadenosine/deoxycytidine kinase
MNTLPEQTIYIISGPCGVGKSTLAKELANHLEKSALVHGDHFLEMYGEGSEPPWEERLNIMWKNIVFTTQTLIQHGFNVIIDIVVEDELEWFCQQFSSSNVKVKYIVLRADKERLIERIEKRGDTYLIDRSLFLLNQLENTPGNEKHLYDTSNKQTHDILMDIINSSKFDLVLS